MEYAIAICDDDNIMAEKLSVSFKMSFESRENRYKH